MKSSSALLLVASAIVAVSFRAHAATDKLERVKSGNARKTPMIEVASSIDGLQSASGIELRTHCASLKRERDLAEKELADSIRDARIAEGSLIDVTKVKPGDAKGPPKPRPQAASLAEVTATKKAASEAQAQRVMLACQLYALGEIQTVRAQKKTRTTKEIVKKCFEDKQFPALKDLACEDEGHASKTK